MSKWVNVRYVLIVLSLAFAVGVAFILGLQIDRARDEALADGRRDARNLASTLAQHTRQSFTAIDLVLQGLAAPELAPILIDPQRVSQAYTILRNRAQVLQGVVSILVLDVDGRVLNSSSRPGAEPTDLSSRPEYTAARDTTGLVISAPFLAEHGASKGQLVMVLSRRLETSDGRFAGVVAASLAVDTFVEFYRRLDIGEHGIIGITRRDGIAIIKYPVEERIFGKSAVGQPIFEAFRHSDGAGELDALYASDGQQRLTAFRAVPDTDVFVNVGLSYDDLLAGWRRSAATEAGAGLALIGLLGLLTFLANRLLRSREREQLAIATRVGRVAAASAEIAAIHTGAGLVHGMRKMVADLIPGAQADVRFALERSGARRDPVIEARQITMPLQAKGSRVLGTLQVTRTEGPALTRQDAAVLSQLAAIGTVALENVELLAESQRLTKQAQRARAEEAAARQRIEEVFATMSEGVYTLDREGRFTFLNDNAVRMLRRDRERLLGHTVWEVYPHMRGTVLEENLNAVVAENRVVEFELAYETGEGPRWMDIRAFPMPEGATVYLRDITQRVETEAKLRQAQKMEAIGQLTGGIAHDFNNLLTVVLGNVDMLAEALEGNPRLRRVAELARDAAMRGATLVAQLLAFARRQALAPRPVDVNALTRNVEDLLRRAIGESIDVRLLRADDLWRANIDPAQMENALLNLALNARDAMPGGGILTIETSNAQLDEGYADDAHVLPGDYVMVAVSDTGTGMTADVRSRAFDPFFTTKATGQGSGLGLSMVYGFVRQSGGYVRIYSEVGQGTTVRMYLPRAASAAVQQTIPVPMETQRGHETILLVEDDELVREHMSETLKSLGYAIIPCASGREALDVLQGGAQPDLLLTDVVLAGGMNGHSVAERFKQLRPNVPVLYMSGYTEKALTQDGRLTPGIHFISKPFRRQEIARKIRDVLAGKESVASLEGSTG